MTARKMIKTKLMGGSSAIRAGSTKHFDKAQTHQGIKNPNNNWFLYTEVKMSSRFEKDDVEKYGQFFSSHISAVRNIPPAAPSPLSPKSKRRKACL